MPGAPKKRLLEVAAISAGGCPHCHSPEVHRFLTVYGGRVVAVLAADTKKPWLSTRRTLAKDTHGQSKEGQWDTDLAVSPKGNVQAVTTGTLYNDQVSDGPKQSQIAS